MHIVWKLKLVAVLDLGARRCGQYLVVKESKCHEMLLCEELKFLRLLFMKFSPACSCSRSSSLVVRPFIQLGT